MFQKKRSSAQCLVRQIPNLDYKEPRFEVSIHAGDDRSGVNLYLDVGTVPGGSYVVNKKELGGPSTILSEVGLIFSLNFVFAALLFQLSIELMGITIYIVHYSILKNKKIKC